MKKIGSLRKVDFCKASLYTNWLVNHRKDSPRVGNDGPPGDVE